MDNQSLAREILGYSPSGYVCCSQTCTYVRRASGLRLVGRISANGLPIASVLLNPQTLQVTNIAR